MTEDNRGQNENTTRPTHQTPEDGINWENPPKERIPRVTSYVICFLTAAGIMVYGFLENTVIEYHADNDNSTIKLANTKKETTTCYKRNEKITYPVFFNLGLGLMGIIFGTIVDRLCLVVEELFQLQIRYKGDKTKLFKSCFSGVNWPAIAVVFLLVVVSYSLGRKTPFVLADIIYILGGIGVGPLLIRLLNLNTESDVDVSRMLEKKKMYPGYTLAWSYYYNHLKPAVEILNKAIQDLLERSSPPDPNEIRLSVNKLILLIPPSTNMTDIDILTKKDEKIVKLKDGEGGNPYPFPVYNFTEYENKYFTMKCVKEPIVALREMRGRVKFVTSDSYEDEVKRFYKTLCEIFENPPNDQCAMKGLVVPITVKVGNEEELKHGKLARIIMAKVYPPPKKNDRTKPKKKRKIPSGRKNEDNESERRHMLPSDDRPMQEEEDENGPSTSRQVPEV